MLDKFTRQFTVIGNEIIDNTDEYSAQELITYTVLVRYANAEHFPDMEVLAEKMRCDIETAKKTIDSLIEKEVIVNNKIVK